MIQTVSNLPSGTSAPNTVLTEYAVSKYHLQPSLAACPSRARSDGEPG